MECAVSESGERASNRIKKRKDYKSILVEWEKS